MPRRSGTMTVWFLISAFRERRPHVACVAETVQHNDRRTFAAGPDMRSLPRRSGFFWTRISDGNFSILAAAGRAAPNEKTMRARKPKKAHCQVSSSESATIHLGSKKMTSVAAIDAKASSTLLRHIIADFIGLVLVRLARLCVGLAIVEIIDTLPVAVEFHRTWRQDCATPPGMRDDAWYKRCRGRSGPDGCRHARPSCLRWCAAYYSRDVVGSLKGGEEKREGKKGRKIMGGFKAHPGRCAATS